MLYHVLMTQQKTTVVLMPGIDGTGIFFEPLIHALPPDLPFSVITYPPNVILSLEEHARFAEQHMPPGNVVIVAESFSGLVGLELLRRHPDNVKGAVFSAAFAEPLHEKLIHGLSVIPALELLIKKVPVSLLDHFLFGPFSRTDLKALLARGIREIDVKCLKQRAQLVAAGYPYLEETFSTPCLYLGAARDRIVPHTASSWFAAHFEEFEHAVFDAPHCLLQTRPDECAAMIADFIERKGE
jgi:pimeloyl-[acyl-carrier protein] methyl ester esterase